MMTYVVRRFKPKLLVFITTGTFNLLSKIRAVNPPEWDRFGSRSGLATGCPRTCAPTSFAFAFATAFDRRERLCQNTVCFVSCQSLFSSHRFSEIRLTGHSGSRCCANSQRASTFRSSRYRLARISPWVLQWYVLCGIPYRGEGHLPRLAQRTGFSSP